MGNAHMGTGPKTSVLNAYNQAHDVPNLFITDGAAMASSVTQNPSLTYMAPSARAAHFAVGGSSRPGRSELACLSPPPQARPDGFASSLYRCANG